MPKTDEMPGTAKSRPPRATKPKPQSLARESLTARKGIEPDWALEQRPGFLIRRLHQIHVALFMKRCSTFGVTPVQYSLMSALAARGIADQTMLASDVALDRTTTTGALRRLEERGLTQRIASDADRRAKRWSMTRQGAKLLGDMEQNVRDAHDETIAALAPGERTTLVTLLHSLIASHETTTVVTDGLDMETA